MNANHMIALAFALVSAMASTTTYARPADSRALPATSGGSVLLTGEELVQLRGRKAMVTLVTKRCETQIDYEPRPTSAFGPDPHYTATGLNESKNNGKQLASDALAAYRQGLCYALTGDKRFAATAQRILDGWSGTLTQITTVQGKGGLNFNIPYMTLAASWVRGANGWDGVAYGDFLRATILPNSTSDNDNNHGMWGTLLEASAAAYLGDGALLTKARDRWTAIFQGAAAVDGTLIREIERSGTTNWRGGPDKGAKGLAYTHYFLLPASLTAKIFADQGHPVWNEEGGRLLGAAFAKAASWTLHPETFPFYASNNGKLEGVRSVAYFPLLLRYYQNADARAVLAQGDAGESGFLLPSIFPISK